MNTQQARARVAEIFPQPFNKAINGVAQVSQPAVSPTSKSAGPGHIERPAGLETRDTADLEICATKIPRADLETFVHLGDQISPSVTSGTAVVSAGLRSQSVISNPGRGGRRYLPYAFTEQLKEEAIPYRVKRHPARS